MCRGVSTSLPVTKVDLISDPFSAVKVIEIFTCNAIFSTEILYCDTFQQLKQLCTGYKLQQLYSQHSPAGIGRYPYPGSLSTYFTLRRRPPGGPPGGLLLRVKYVDKDLAGQVPPVRFSVKEQDSGPSVNVFNDDSFTSPEGDSWQSNSATWKVTPDLQKVPPEVVGYRPGYSPPLEL